MRAYELMIIFEAELEDADVQAQLKTVTGLIEGAGGTVHKTDLWGKRRFAYEIDHKVEGIYVVLELATEGGDLSPLDRSLRLADEVIRHKLIRLPDREAARRGLYGEENIPVKKTAESDETAPVPADAAPAAD
jgi:small subunit ribosomal protein S6